MFVIDFIAAFLIACVLSLLFAGAARRWRLRHLRDLSVQQWLIILALWLCGTFLVALGPLLTGSHWLPFAVTGLLVGLSILGIVELPTLQEAVYAAGAKGAVSARSVIGAYFCITTLLLFIAVSVRYYIVHLA